MTSPLPVYIEDNKTFHSDNCEPVLRAWCEDKIKLEALGRDTYPFRPLANGELKGVSTVGYWDAITDQEWGLDWHRNEGIEFSFIEGGTMPYSIGGQDYMLTSENMTISRPWQPHKVGNPNINISRFHWLVIDVGVRQPHQYWKWPSWIILSKNDLEELTKYLRQNEQPVWKVNQEIRGSFHKIGEAVSKHKIEENKESVIRLNINMLLIQILNLFRKGTVDLNDSLTRTVRTTEIFLHNLTESIGEPWVLESMAHKCGLGPTRFVHYCKQITNLTPMQYLNHLRIIVASEMLINELDKSVIDVALECGFATGQYFSTVFKKHHKCSPLMYRKANVGKELAIVNG